MTAGIDFAGIRGSKAAEIISAVLPQPLSSIPMSRVEGHPVVRSPKQMRLHRALDELGWIEVIHELNVARLTHHSYPSRSSLRRTGRFLLGFGIWRLALLEGQGRNLLHRIPAW
jgi:hypothetical protein